jgi:hypothetical protein
VKKETTSSHSLGQASSMSETYWLASDQWMSASRLDVSRILCAVG